MYTATINDLPLARLAKIHMLLAFHIESFVKEKCISNDQLSLFLKFFQQI